MPHDHAHVPETGGDRRLWIAVAINVLLTIAQVIDGVIARSLSLVADALHNLNDAASIGIALIARRIARKPPDKRRTYGYRRAAERVNENEARVFMRSAPQPRDRGVFRGE